MAAYTSMLSVLRACSKCGPVIASLVNRNTNNFIRTVKVDMPARLLSTSQCAMTQSQSTHENQKEYLDEFEVSYDEFKYVEQILPVQVVPEIPKHESYPTPSGWYPPNDALRSQYTFLVRRTRNHMLPVYPITKRFWYGINHMVFVKRVEGDIWALESALKEYLQKKTGIINIRTQVHEVSRQVRIRGLHAPLVAEFLLGCGM